MSQNDLSRRRFLTQVAVAVPAAAVLLETGVAQDLPRLALDDPSAKALLYVEDTNKVDRSNPQAARWAADQNCANCSQIQGKDGDAWRPCAIFPGKLVASPGWCSVWQKMP